jgi:hypothetical protein
MGCKAQQVLKSGRKQEENKGKSGYQENTNVEIGK